LTGAGTFAQRTSLPRPTVASLFPHLVLGSLLSFTDAWPKISRCWCRSSDA